MPGILSFKINKALDVENVLIDLPSYKVLQGVTPIFDPKTDKVIGTLLGIKQIYKGPDDTILRGVYSYGVNFVPETGVKGSLTFILLYSASELSPDGTTEQQGTYDGVVDANISSGDFLQQQGLVKKTKDSTGIRKYVVDYPYGYCNIESDDTFPKQLNAKEYVTLTSLDTPAWAINPNDKSELICVEAGKWTILSQYQLVGIRDGKSALYGFFNFNGVDVPNSDAVATTNLINDESILAVGGSGYFNKGDKVKIGIESRNLDSSNVLGVVIKKLTVPDAPDIPSLIITFNRLY